MNKVLQAAGRVIRTPEDRGAVLLLDDRKQTLTSGERYITQELKELESKILGAHERLITLEHRLFSELLESISAQLDRIQRPAIAVAQLDVLTALALVAA